MSSENIIGVKHKMYQFIIHYQTDGGERDRGGRFYSDCFNSWDEVRDGLWTSEKKNKK